MYKDIYNTWLNEKSLSLEEKRELLNIKENEEEIEDRFYKELNFGTAGLRGKMGLGLNRMNVYIVKRAAMAISKVILDFYEIYEKLSKKDLNEDELEFFNTYLNIGKEKIKTVVISYDSRINSREFAYLSARVFASYGIKVYIFNSLRPTPELSFAVRKLNTFFGVNVTASHNPKEYNGYKVYFKEGSQIKDDIADKIFNEIKKINVFNDLNLINLEDGIKNNLIEVLEDEDNPIDKEYLNEVLSLRQKKNEELDLNIKIGYSPLNGAGNIPVRKVFNEIGFKNVFVVKEEEEPNGNFPTLTYPNPEDLKSFTYLEKLHEKYNLDILIATDPDSDRIRCEVIHKGEIIPLNGNQIGAILIYYILENKSKNKTLKENSGIIKSIVTGNFGKAIAKSYGVKTFETLTGFKNIADLQNKWDKTKEYSFVFAYEESIGYNASNYVRDKDAVSSAMLIAEMAAFYKKKNMTLIDLLNSLYEKYGYYNDETISTVLTGVEGEKRIKRMMKEFRVIYPDKINEFKLEKIVDYEKSKEIDFINNSEKTINIEKTNAISFYYENLWFSLRPSGTEPKIKLYIYVKESSKEKSKKLLKDTKDKVLKILQSIK